jgi:hypothetical protein
MAEPAVPNPPLGPAADPLKVMLVFLQHVPNCDVFTPVNPDTIFRAMKAEIPGLKPEDLVFAGGLARQLAHSLNKTSWYLRGGSAKTPMKPMKPAKPSRTRRVQSQKT